MADGMAIIIVGTIAVFCTVLEDSNLRSTSGLYSIKKGDLLKVLIIPFSEDAITSYHKKTAQLARHSSMISSKKRSSSRQGLPILFAVKGFSSFSTKGLITVLL